MGKFLIRTGSFVEHHLIQRIIYGYGYKWFLDDSKIDIGNCGFILIVGDIYVTLSTENYILQPNVIDGFVEIRDISDLPNLCEIKEK